MLYNHLLPILLEKEMVTLFEQTQTAMQTQAARSVDIALVIRNWLFGWYIVEFENGGAKRAKLYGKKLIKRLSEKLTANLGKGFSKRSLEQFRRFYLGYQKITQTVSAQSQMSQTVSELPQAILNNSNVLQIVQTLSAQFQLSWSHYVFLLTVKNPEEKAFYEIEAIKENWSLRELKRQFGSSLYERLALSRDKEEVKKLAKEGQIITQPQDVIKNPYVLEFLGLEERAKYSESDLETAIIDKLEHFLLELGKGFLFEARQKRFTFAEDHYFVDLVFYNRLLRCYTIIDLKIGELTHQDLGQMQMYVNYYDRHVKLDDENSTIGIIICKKNKESLVEITLPKKTNIHASEYQLYLPSKEELQQQLEEAQRNWEADNET
jgi:predicted nuclease of restriction endonuclease-like (RecB) superfamily